MLSLKPTHTQPHTTESLGRKALNALFQKCQIEQWLQTGFPEVKRLYKTENWPFLQSLDEVPLIEGF